jgi:predicted ATPase
VTENVVRNVSIHKFHPLVQDVLKVAACLCFRFPKSLLRQLGEAELLKHQDQIDLVPHDDQSSSHVVWEEQVKQKMDRVLDIAVEGCLLEIASETEVKFTHESIHQAFLTTIPQKERHLLGRRLVRYLQETMEESDSGTFIVKAIEHLGACMGHAQSIDEVSEFCKLTLAAARLEVSRRCNFSQGAHVLQLAATIAIERVCGCTTIRSPSICLVCLLLLKATQVD